MRACNRNRTANPTPIVNNTFFVRHATMTAIIPAMRRASIGRDSGAVMVFRRRSGKINPAKTAGGTKSKPRLTEAGSLTRPRNAINDSLRANVIVPIATMVNQTVCEFNKRISSPKPFDSYTDDYRYDYCKYEVQSEWQIDGDYRDHSSHQ